MDHSQTAISDRTVDTTVDSRVQAAVQGLRRKYRVGKTPRLLSEASPLLGGGETSATSPLKKGMRRRKRRGIQLKPGLPGPLQPENEQRSRTGRKPSRQAPGPDPGRARPPPGPGTARSAEQFVPTSPTPPPRAATRPEALASGPVKEPRPRRRLFWAAAMGLLAGVLVHALFTPEQTPAPGPPALSAMGEEAAKRGAPPGNSIQRRWEERASLSSRPAPGSASRPMGPAVESYRPADSYRAGTAGVYPDAGYYGPAGDVADTYRPTEGVGTDTVGAYPFAGYRAVPSEPVQEPYGTGTWPSTEGPSAQRTYSQPLTRLERRATRPWGNVDESRAGRRPPPAAQYPRYPMPETSYGFPGAYPGESVGLAPQQWGSDYYPSRGPSHP
jgi:hypothetical protein